MEMPVTNLLKSLRATAAANFNASRRLDSHDKRLTRLTAFSSSYVIILTILPYFLKNNSSPVADLYNFVTVVFAIVILIASLLQYSNNNVAKAEEHHRSGLELNELYRLLLLEDADPSKETLVDFTNRYGVVLQKYSINHDEIDYAKYQIDHPEAHAWLKWPQKLLIRFRLATWNATPDVFLVIVTVLFGWLIWHGVSPHAGAFFSSD